MAQGVTLALFKFEPFVFHIAARSVAEGQQLVSLLL